MDAHVSVEALEKFKRILTQFSKNMSVEAQKMQLHLKKTHAQLEQKHFQLKKQLQMCQDPISYERTHQQLMEFERLFAGFCHAAQECIKSFQRQELMATNREKTVVTIDRKVGVLKEYLGREVTHESVEKENGIIGWSQYRIQSIQDRIESIKPYLKGQKKELIKSKMDQILRDISKGNKKNKDGALGELEFLERKIFRENLFPEVLEDRLNIPWSRDPTKNVTNPDFKVDGDIIELKTTWDELTKNYIRKRIKEANL